MLFFGKNKNKVLSMTHYLYSAKNQKKVAITLAILSTLFLFIIIALIVVDVLQPPEAKQLTGNITIVIVERTNTSRSTAQVKAVRRFMPFVKAILVVSSLDVIAHTTLAGQIPVVVIPNISFANSRDVFLMLPTLAQSNTLLTSDIFWLGDSVIPRKSVRASDLVVITHKCTRAKMFGGLQTTRILVHETQEINGDVIPSTVVHLSRITDSIKGVVLDLLQSPVYIYSPQLCENLLFISDDQKYNDQVISLSRKVTKEKFVCVAAVDSVAASFDTFTDNLFLQISEF